MCGRPKQASYIPVLACETCCCCRQVASVVSDSVRPQRRQPTRLPRPWDSPGKNTGVGCHFLLQCMKLKSEREVAQSCPTLRDSMDCSLPGSSVHGICQARGLEWGAIAFFVVKPDAYQFGVVCLFLWPLFALHGQGPASGLTWGTPEVVSQQCPSGVQVIFVFDNYLLVKIFI